MESIWSLMQEEKRIYGKDNSRGRNDEGCTSYQSRNRFQIVEREIPKPGQDTCGSSAGLWCMPQ